jgi:hypothetical protein
MIGDSNDVRAHSKLRVWTRHGPECCELAVECQCIAFHRGREFVPRLKRICSLDTFVFGTYSIPAATLAHASTIPTAQSSAPERRHNENRRTGNESARMNSLMAPIHLRHFSALSNHSTQSQMHCSRPPPRLLLSLELASDYELSDRRGTA